MLRLIKIRRAGLVMIEIKDLDLANMQKDARKAAEYYIKKGKFNAYPDVGKIEPYFLKANNFKAGTIFDCDYEYRHVMINEDKASYYCSPFFARPAFKIRKCAAVKKVELLDNVTGDSALTGALLFGVAGAVVGGSNKKAVLIVRLYTDDISEPIVDIHVLTTALSRNDENFAMCFENANKIYGYFKALAESNNISCQHIERSQDDVNDTVEKIRKFKGLLDDGIITQEEFEAKKKQLLGL